LQLVHRKQKLKKGKIMSNNLRKNFYFTAYFQFSLMEKKLM